MTTPNRPEFPDWHQREREVPPHVGPTQRELLARRIRSLRNVLIGASFVGAATFTALAAYHTESKSSGGGAAAADFVQDPFAAAQSQSTSLFNAQESQGFSAETHDADEHDDEHDGHESDDDDDEDGYYAAQSSGTLTQPAAGSATGSSVQPASSQTTTRHRTQTVSS